MPRRGFIHLGAVVGLGVAAPSVLVACGGGGFGGESGASTIGGQASGRQAIARASEVPPGSALKFRDDSGDLAVLVHLEESGDFVAYSVVCTHQGCPVAYKYGKLVCPCHGSVFNPAQGGAVVQGPAQKPLREIKVAIKDGKVAQA